MQAHLVSAAHHARLQRPSQCKEVLGADGLSQGMPFVWQALDPNVAPFNVATWYKASWIKKQMQAEGRAWPA